MTSTGGTPEHGDPFRPEQPAGHAQPTQPFPAAAPASEPHASAAPQPAHDPQPGAAEPRRERRRGLLLPVAAAAVVAALVGGGVGAGVATAMAPHDPVGVTNTGSAQNVTINDTKSATAISAVAAKASPSVVTIAVSATGESGTGSGIVLTNDGYVLTNNHVVTLDGDSSNGTVSVTTANGRIYKASIVGTDPLNDLAVIKLSGASGLTPATFADSSRLNVGDTAIAIGAPLGLSGTVTNGIVSALNRSISVQSSAVPNSGDGSSGGNGNGNDPFNFWNNGNGSGSTSGTSSTVSLAVVQTDAAINPGNSGGALLNANGEVIGVNVAIASAGSSSSSGGQSGSIGVGFAIPSNVAKRIATELKNKEKATHGRLGASVGDAASGSSVAGAQVQSVTSGGAAAAAGVKQGDVVTRFNGVVVQSATDLTAQVRALPGGSSAKLTYVRGGQARTVQVKLGTVSG